MKIKTRITSVQVAEGGIIVLSTKMSPVDGEITAATPEQTTNYPSWDDVLALSPEITNEHMIALMVQSNPDKNNIAALVGKTAIIDTTSIPVISIVSE